MPLLTTGAGTFQVAATTPFLWTPTDNPAAQNTGTNTATFSGVSIGGTSASDVIVAVFSSEATVASAITINGTVSMTKAIEEATTLSGLQIWYATGISGATADFVVTAAGSMFSEVLQVGKIAGVGSSTPSFTNSASAASISVTVPFGGVAIIGMFGGVLGADPVWTNAIQDLSTTTLAGAERLLTAEASASAMASATNFSSAHAVYAAWGP